jgi:hypothetical protein
MPAYRINEFSVGQVVYAKSLMAYVVLVGRVNDLGFWTGEWGRTPMGGRSSVMLRPDDLSPLTKKERGL